MKETRDVEVEDVDVKVEEVEAKEALWTMVKKNWKPILIGAGLVTAVGFAVARTASKVRSMESEAFDDDGDCIDTSEEDTDSALETEETTETEPFAESTEVVNQ